MYPMNIWQGIINVHGNDRSVRVVLFSATEGTVEWSASRDAMGFPVWTPADTWPEMVADITRSVLRGADDVVTVGDVRRVLNNRKISLIKLVREATQKHAMEIAATTPGIFLADHHRCMGLKDAKDLVERYIAGGGTT